jgi:hypothetical protein
MRAAADTALFLLDRVRTMLLAMSLIILIKIALTQLG